MDVSTPLPVEVHGLSEAAAQRGSTVAFQSTLAAATQAVCRALESEEQAEAAALSLAQREALAEMTEELRSAADALGAALTEQGRCLLPPEPPAPKRWRLRRTRPEAEPTPSSWWFALSEALGALEAGADALAGIADGQPPEAPSRALGTATAALLREHHDRLLEYAERWMG